MALKISGSEIRDNRVSEDGGVVYIDVSPWSPVSFEDCTIDSNKARGVGGVLFASGGSMSTFTSCDVLGNIAGANGGALYAAQDSTIVLSGSSFVGNRAFASSPSLDGGVDADHRGEVLDGDHIFVASTDMELIECSTGDNVFADPSEDTGVMMLNAESACF
jgi:predicted outer membrane repeat protein